ncbi:patatin-like phospholipase family protein [Dactylosporangium sp. CA-233914]|uniref:patatin-like phospholipase family protein n=1 Tax=Dactylosporangium sp. CA-233914 TaxID=3239934 RepID=UPI003D8EAA01
MASTALVLGAGGITGVAWQLGILVGLHDRGIDLGADADLILGTSAGAMTGALIAAFGDPRTSARSLIPRTTMTGRARRRDRGPARPRRPAQPVLDAIRTPRDTCCESSTLPGNPSPAGQSCQAGSTSSMRTIAMSGRTLAIESKSASTCATVRP